MMIKHNIQRFPTIKFFTHGLDDIQDDHVFDFKDNRTLFNLQQFLTNHLFNNLKTNLSDEQIDLIYDD